MCDTQLRAECELGENGQGLFQGVTPAFA